MNLILKLISFTGLVLTIIPCFLVFTNVIPVELSKKLMLIGTFMWFGSAVIWIKKDKTSF